MVSSRDGAKGLNGFDANGKAEASKIPDATTPPLAGLVDELAQALGVARDSLGERRTQAPTPFPATSSPPEPTLAIATATAMPSGLPVAVGRHFFDDEEDDANMPIPSTWRAPPEPPKTGSFNDQLRAAALGFGTGLVLVVPVVLLLTGKLGDFSLTGSRSTSSRQEIRSTSTPPPAPEPRFQSRNVPTTTVAAAKPDVEEQPAERAPAPVPATAPLPPPSWTEAISEGRRRISAGDILAAREVLSRPAAAEHGEALLSLAETYDPNMLAAWGVRGVTADVMMARSLYARAINAGAEPAKARLRALE